MVLKFTTDSFPPLVDIFLFPPIFQVQIALNCLAFLGLIAAVISSIKKSFFYFLIHVITIVIKLGFYITFINYLGLAEQNLTYQSMTKELKTLIEVNDTPPLFK